MGAAVVVGALVLVLVAGWSTWERWAAEAASAAREEAREDWNAYAYGVYAPKPGGWFPYELPDGTVRWYRVAHAMDHGRATSGR